MNNYERQEQARKKKERLQDLEDSTPTQGAKDSFNHKAYGSWKQKEVPENKKIIFQYMDAKELAEETENDLLQHRTVLQDKVKGSNPEFPYQEQSFTITGVDLEEDYEERLLRERLANAEKIRLEAEAVINSAPVRIQRIIRFKVMQDMTWQEIAEKMNARSEDSVRMEFNRWMKEK